MRPYGLMLLALSFEVAVYAQEDPASAKNSAAKAKSWTDGIELTQLPDPATLAIKYKDTLSLVSFDSVFSENAMDRKSISLTVEPDILASYNFHPKAHANVNAGFTLKGYPVYGKPSNVLEPPPDVTPIAVGSPGFYRVTTAGGIETAPVRLEDGGQSWKTRSTKLEVAAGGFVPMSDRFHGALIVGYALAYLDGKQESADGNGTRHKASALYVQPLAQKVELLLRYEYSWGNAMKHENRYYAAELSRTITDTFLGPVFERLYGDKVLPRFFVRYYKGGVAPSFIESHGFEYGIGAIFF